MNVCSNRQLVLLINKNLNKYMIINGKYLLNKLLNSVLKIQHNGKLV